MTPQTTARLAGALYLIVMIAAPFSELVVRASLVVYNDGAATAANILGSEQLYRLGGVAMLVGLVCDVFLSFLFYELLKPVSRSLAIVAASFRLIEVAIMAVNLFNHVAPLVLLKSDSYAGAFTAEQIQAQVLAFQRVYAQGFNVAMVFFGFNCALLGYLIYRSSYLPRLIGALLELAGLCYVTNSLAHFLAPSLGALIFSIILTPCFIGELALTLWLLIQGVNVNRFAQYVNSRAAP